MSVWKGKVTRLQKKVKYKSLSKGEYKSLSGKGRAKVFLRERAILDLLDLGIEMEILDLEFDTIVDYPGGLSFIYIFCCDLENKIENVYFGIYLWWFVGYVTFEKTFSTLKRGKCANFCVSLMAPP